MPEHLDIHIRAPHQGDGDGLAQSWIDTGTYYANLSPELFQVPAADGLAESLEAWILNSPSENHLVLVAEVGNQVVGAVGACSTRRRLMQPTNSCVMSHPHALSSICCLCGPHPGATVSAGGCWQPPRPGDERRAR